MSSPHYAFQTNMKWAQDAYKSGHTFTLKSNIYDQQIKKLVQWLNMTDFTSVQKNLLTSKQPKN